MTSGISSKTSLFSFMTITFRIILSERHLELNIASDTIKENEDDKLLRIYYKHLFINFRHQIKSRTLSKTAFCPNYLMLVTIRVIQNLSEKIIQLFV